MLKNYFRIAWRNISRHKIYTAINVTGLAMGICACIVIYLITDFEFSFDRDHPDGDRIYRIVGESQGPEGNKRFLNSVFSDVAGLQTQIPGLEAKAGFYSYSEGVSVPDGKNPPKKFSGRIEGSWTSTTIITWPQYFDVFHYQWLAGNAASLNEPFKVVLSENRAKKYFGDMAVNKMIGRTVIYDDSLKVTVSGIVKDWKGQTDLGYTDFLSISTATHSFLKKRIATEDWSSLRPHASMAFVKLARGTTAETINQRFATYIKEHMKFQTPGAKLTMWLQPLSDIHFTKEFHRGDDGDDFRKPYLPTLYTLIGVAVFILVLAVMNFINLSTAQSIRRAREIGVRKVLGGSRQNILLQFLMETLMLTVLAAAAAVLLVRPVLFSFREYVPAGVVFHLSDTSMLVFLSVTTLLTSLLAGFYPAKVLAAYLPVLSLKGAALQKGTENISIRKALIVFQFTVSLLFIVAGIVIGKQINFMRSADKGFNTDAIIVIDQWNDPQGKLNVFAQKIKQVKGVDKVLLQANAPMGFAQMGMSYTYKGKQEKQVATRMEAGDDSYIPFYRMRLVAGRNMLHSDSLNDLVVNEAMTRAMGFARPQDAVGEMLYSQDPQGEKAYPVVGVVADFHQESFHEAIQPAAIGNYPDVKHSIAIKVMAEEKDTKDVKAILSGAEAEWKKVFPGEPFNFSFLNESITWLYEQEQKTAWLTNTAMGITIFISCMGLFGLGMFTAERRTKEIGIRKVLGAGVADIAILLNRDFVVLVLIAFAIASPLAWWCMHRWLQDFAYRTTMSWWVFAVAGLSAVVIALLTVSFQALKAAVANPVDSLRTE
jgi:ABC-type antimicrobial peptide transport system permease subunit